MAGEEAQRDYQTASRYLRSGHVDGAVLVSMHGKRPLDLHSLGEHAVYRLLDRRPGLDAVFVASDLMAAGALRALRHSGRRVPDDVAVIGFEDSPLARHTDPKLTTVRRRWRPWANGSPANCSG